MNTTFERVAPTTPLTQLEEEILAFWKANDLFVKSLTWHENGPEFSFFEGPPTANGNPGIHHVQARAYKDLFPRYKTMRGYKVRRQAGWDCHGLPVEIEVEKRLGFSGKPAIEKYGVEPFNKQCRLSVMTYENKWRELTERIGYWTDLDRPYMTMSNDYVESVWWSLKELWNKGLIYLGYKVVPYCARCGTPLSSAEAGSEYKEVKEPSIFVRFPLTAPEALGLPAGTALMVWTTTPWTLPSNTGAAVKADMEYVAVEHEGGALVLARCLARQALGLEEDPVVIRSFMGRDLVGQTYSAPYTWFDFGDKVGHRVVAGSFVTAEDGSGIVHIAPAFGADDMQVGREYDLPVVHAVKPDGHFAEQAGFLAGLGFKEADPKVIADLKERGLLVRSQMYAHSYPHCWRCHNPLLYYATDSWYINNTRLQQRLIEKNQTINWHPAHIKNGRYGDWLNNLIDWAISRTRYWGTPLPIWVCDSCDHKDMIGSFQELAERSKQPLDVKDAAFDPHRPYVDDIEMVCPECGGTMLRVPDVIDCWYDSGSMPFASFHYPFENKEQFEKHFPADFICEGLDQTRGWFNSLHQLGVMLFDSIAYRDVICHGLVLDENGEKMSKSRGNVVNPWDVLNVHGADALRWYIYTSTTPDNYRRISVDLVGESTKHLSTWWNTWQFFVLNANAAKLDLSRPLDATKLTDIDRWVLGKLNKTVAEVTDALDVYEPTRAARCLESFVEGLSNWYVRRNRRRFWQNDEVAYATLYRCLVVLAKLQAPFTPFLAETMYRNLVLAVDPQAPMSVHLCDWPSCEESMIDEQLLRDGDLVVELVSVGRAARSASKQKVRQPLAEMLVGLRHENDRPGVERFRAHILDELNVKQLSFLQTGEHFLDYQVKPNLPVLGPRYGKLLGGIRKLLQGDQAKSIAVRVLAGETIETEINGSPVVLNREDLLIEVRSPEGYAAQESEGLVVAFSTVITEELRLEGISRDVIRHIQEQRKQADFDITDRITVWISGEWEELRRAVEAHRATVLGETLCDELLWGDAPEGTHRAEIELVKNSDKFTLAVQRVR